LSLPLAPLITSTIIFVSVWQAGMFCIRTFRKLRNKRL
jgi:hypothetical protein